MVLIVVVVTVEVIIVLEVAVLEVVTDKLKNCKSNLIRIK